ncbi:hypothetical protein ACWDR0_04565 [Streptomyces sp. NPDC003691]
MKPHRKSRSSPGPGSGPGPEAGPAVRGGLLAGAFALLPVIVVAGGDGLREALDFTTGVLALLALTAAVAWGLLATDRLLLSPRHRLVAQAVHRATAAAALGFLVLHASVKTALGHVGAVGALIPFGLGFTGTEGLIGFGSLAGLLMVVVAATGALRSVLAGRPGVAGRWRALHMLAYPAWCAALIHGLFAGRPAAGWVVALYCLALVAVGGAVSLRLLPRPVRRRLAARVALLTADGTAPADPGGGRPAGDVPNGGRLAGDVPDGGFRNTAAGTAEVGPPAGSRHLPEPESGSGYLPGGALTGAGPPPPMLPPPFPPLYEAPLYEPPPRPAHAPAPPRPQPVPPAPVPEPVPRYAAQDTSHAFAAPVTGTEPVPGAGFRAAYDAVSRPRGRDGAGYGTGPADGPGTAAETGTGRGAVSGTRDHHTPRTVPGLFPPRPGEPWSTPAGDRT